MKVNPEGSFFFFLKGVGEVELLLLRHWFYLMKINREGNFNPICPFLESRSKGDLDKILFYYGDYLSKSTSIK